MRWPRTAIALVTAIVLITSFSAPNASRAQTGGAIRMRIDGGFASYFKEEAFVPLRITLTNPDSAFDGELFVRNTRDGVAERYSQRVSIGANATRRVTLFVPGDSNSFEVNLANNAGVVLSDTAILRRLGPNDRLIGVVSDPPDAFNFSGDTTAVFGSGAYVSPFALADLPDRGGALDALDVLIFNAVDTAALSTDQRNAITTWVLGGGHLLIAGGAGASLTRTGLSDLAPAEVGASLINGDLRGLDALTQPARISAPAPVPTATVPLAPLTQIRPGSRVLASAPETPLIVRRTLGRGVIDQLAFDPSAGPLRGWNGQATLLQALFGGYASSRLQPVFTESAQSAVAALPAPQLPSPLIAFAFLALYVLIIGPINFLLLRRLKRTSLAWVTLPLLTAMFTGLGLAAGFQLRGSRPQTHSLSVTLADVQTQQRRVYSLTGVFSPRPLRTDIDIGRSVLTGIWPDGSTSESAKPIFVEVGDPGAIRMFDANPSGVRGLSAVGDANASREIEALVTYVPPSSASSDPMIDVRVTNISEDNLRSCAVLAGLDYTAFGDLSAGATQSARVTLRTNHPQTRAVVNGFGTGGPTYYASRYHGTTTSGSSSSQPTADDFPFEFNGAASQDALVNWQTFEAGSLNQEARIGLVRAVLRPDFVSRGASIACWRETPPVDGAQPAIANAQRVDHHLVIWHTRTEPHVVQPSEVIPIEAYAWELSDASAPAAIDSAGLNLQPGDYVLTFAPWFDLRTTSAETEIELELEITSGPGSTTNSEFDIDYYDWQSGEYKQLARRQRTGRFTDAITGATISANGEARLRLSIRDEGLTVRRMLLRATQQ
jgi:hypothetical protein